MPIQPVPPPVPIPLRDSVKEISPPWLSNDAPATNGAPPGVGGRFMYNLGLTYDLLLEKMNQAMKARMPTLCDPSCLPFIGDDRVMPQGPGESNQSYAARLQRAFPTWQHAGSRLAVMGQVSAYLTEFASYQAELAGQLPVVTIVGDSGDLRTTWDTYYNTNNPITEPPSHVRVDSPGNWNWDNQYLFWRCWLIMFWALQPLTPSGTAATVASYSDGFVTVTGLSGMPSTLDTTYYLTVSNAAHSGNNGTFQIVKWISATSVIIANPAASLPDSDSGSLHWRLAQYPGVAPAPVFGAPGITFGTNTNISVGLQIEGQPNSVNASGYFVAMQTIVRLWKQASTLYPVFIHSFGGGDQTSGYEFSPNSSVGSGNPNGTFGNWSQLVNGEMVPGRVTGVPMGRFNAYCDGTAIFLNGSFTPTGT
jgi:hypothetical protein